jgi:prophage antirepressor-like protein
MDKGKELIPFTYVEREHQENIGEVVRHVRQKDLKVRTVLIDGEVWWIAKDVCDVLGLGNVTETLRNMPDDEKDIITRASDPKLFLGSLGGAGREGGAQNLNIINEPGLFRLIFQSRKPGAEQFKRWVFHEVLPSIVKKGYYRVAGYDPENIRELVQDQVKREMRRVEPSFEVKQLINFLDTHLIVTGVSRDIVEFHRLYSEYENNVEIRLEKDVFLNVLSGHLHGVKVNRRGCFINCCRLRYDNAGRRI